MGVQRFDFYFCFPLTEPSFPGCHVLRFFRAAQETVGFLRSSHNGAAPRTKIKHARVLSSTKYTFRQYSVLRFPAMNKKTVNKPPSIALFLQDQGPLLSF